MESVRESPVKIDDIYWDYFPSQYKLTCAFTSVVNNKKKTVFNG